MIGHDDAFQEGFFIMKKSTAFRLVFFAVIVAVMVYAAVSGGPFVNTAWSLLPPVVAIGLALATKEVYSSLFLGVVVGGLLYANFNFEGMLNHVFNDGIVSVLSDSYNVGILVFLVVLGIMVSLMNKAGGSRAFGRWAASHIKTKTGAQLATIALGILIFIDDYFNCLTVGSVMRPVTDKQGISREKLSYLIDATAAPVCIIAPVSSWAAAVSAFVRDSGFSGFEIFIKAIPFNFYALLTIVMMVWLALTKYDFGPMAKFEATARPDSELDALKALANGQSSEDGSDKGRVIDLVIPIAILIVACVTGMLYSGGFFSGTDFVTAFSQSDASVGLMLGSAITLVLTIAYFMIRRTMSFSDMMECVPKGFESMVSAILILTFAWSLKAMSDSLGSKVFVETVVKGSAQNFQAFLPAIVFLIGCFLAFATGTSWGTFGILIPITLGIFPLTNPIGVVCVSACMAGAVCGDHCSPISDTTIMSSAGAQCNHINHVSTQLPYAMTVAAVSCVCYLISGFVPNAAITLPLGIALMVGTLYAIKYFNTRKGR